MKIFRLNALVSGSSESAVNGGCSVPVQHCSKTFLAAVDYSVNQTVLVVSCETLPPLTGSRSEVDMIITETYEIQLVACTSEVFLCPRFSPWYLWISSKWWSVSTCVTLPQDSSGLQRKRDCNDCFVLNISSIDCCSQRGQCEHYRDLYEYFGRKYRMR